MILQLVATGMHFLLKLNSRTHLGAVFTALRLYAIWAKSLKILVAVVCLGLVPISLNIVRVPCALFVSEN